MSELRKDIITGRWVIIDSERVRKPNDFPRTKLKPMEGFCPFCPGNEPKTPPEILAYRSDDSMPNAPGWIIRVVPNKFPVLMIEGDLGRQAEGIFDKMNGIGAHELIIETPDHQATLGNLSEKRLEDLLWAYRDHMLDLQKDKRFNYILISKNHGVPGEASFLHSHSQLFAFPIVPAPVREELEGSKNYFSFKERCVFCDIIRQELSEGVRVVAERSGFIVLNPYASRFPFETWILPKVHHSAFERSKNNVYEGLAEALKKTLMRIDEVLEHPPYDLVLHTSPRQEADNDYYHWHFELIPRLLAPGTEWRTGFHINPTPPEEAAYFLRSPAETDIATEGLEWDLFVCHASEDKDDFVRPLVHKIRQNGEKVWYDELTLKLGDSLQRSINKGLKHSRYGLVILSSAFFSKEWPQRELDGLATKEIRGRKVILPIWHKVSLEEVRDYSPILADRLAVSSDEELDVIVQKILEAIA